jgi:hypothetical protein
LQENGSWQGMKTSVLDEAEAMGMIDSDGKLEVGRVECFVRVGRMDHFVGRFIIGKTGRDRAREFGG